VNPVTEIELKLSFPPEAVRRIRAHPLLKARVRPIVRKLFSIYFDTPGLDLWQRGVTLRVRRAGGRWLQTVKGGGTVQAGLHERVEIETEIAGPYPDCARIADGALTRIFASRKVSAQLKPVFVTEVSRSSRLLELDPGAAVEVSIDRGEIRSGEAAESVCELELELKSGPAGQLYSFARKLLETMPLRVENRSKADRGYTLLRGERPAPAKATATALAPELTVSDAFRAIAWTTLNHLQVNEHGMLEGRDPEYLHQMRVALRRLRSAFGEFTAVLPKTTANSLLTEFKWLAGVLGPARDWDVFVFDTLPPMREAFAEHAALKRFSRECMRLRRETHRKARRAVASARYQRLVLDFAAWITAEKWVVEADEVPFATARSPAREFAAAVLERRYARVRKRGRKLRQSSLAELHRLRIAVKKLRYAMDFLATVFAAKRARNMLSHLSRLQNILGAMNDAAAVERLAHEAFGARPGRVMSEARGIVLGWSRGRALTLRRELRGAWHAYRAAKKFW
jgi:inorganic triphosphatase YgiF